MSNDTGNNAREIGREIGVTIFESRVVIFLQIIIPKYIKLINSIIHAILLMN